MCGCLAYYWRQLCRAGARLLSHIFFDLDGTLTNPRLGITACIRHALLKLNAPVPADDELAQWIGPPLQASFQQALGSSEQATEAVQLYRDRFARVGLYENHVYDGIPAMLSTLASQQYTLWVTTSKPQVFATQIIQHFQLNSFFTAVYGSELDGTRTSKSDLLAHVLATEKIDAANAIMVGDRCHDIIGAEHNALPTIGVTWGFGSAKELQAAGATTLCHTPATLPQVLATIG